MITWRHLLLPHYWPIWLVIVVAAWVMYRLTEPSPYRARNHVEETDYRHMRAIFGVSKLPPSFKIIGVRHCGLPPIPGPDGPPPVHYQIGVDASDFEALSKTLARWAVGEKEARSGFWAAKDFNSPLFNRWENGWRSDSFTLAPCYYVALQHTIVVDEETSPKLHMYVSTTLPYMDPDSDQYGVVYIR